MKIISLKDFMKNYNLKKDTMNDGELQKIYSYPVYPSDSEINSDKRFVSMDNGSKGGSHWFCLLKKINHFTSMVSVDSQKKLYLINYLKK